MSVGFQWTTWRCIPEGSTLHNHCCENLRSYERDAVFKTFCVLNTIESRRMGWAGHVACRGEKRHACRTFVGKPEGKRPLGKLRHRWEDNIKMDHRQVGWCGVDWIGMA
jgi:hypothetical protein